MGPTVFLLSPANCSGKRGRIVMSERAAFDLAVRLRAPEGAPIGEVFTFMSGLYFRGKLAYATAFARIPEGATAVAGTGVFVITPSAGLRAPDTLVTREAIRGFAGVEVDAANPKYRRPLERSAKALAADIGSDTRVVLLGSIASGKYVDVLQGIFRDRLMFPREFVGRGDMSRGGLMLRCVTAMEELSYIPVAGATRRGVRPPKLVPLAGRLGTSPSIGEASERRERVTGAERAAKRAPASDRVGESEGRSPSDE